MTPAELRAARASLTLSQVELAGWLGVHPITIARWELGTRTITAPGMLRLALKQIRLELAGTKTDSAPRP